MNRNKLKAYAPKARRDFIRAVTEQAAKVGIAKDYIEPVEVKGDVAIIGGRAFPRKMAEQRRKLDYRIGLHGFDQVMEGGAYTWFNRFAAIRYMEVHEYFEHGYRILSHPEVKDSPEILEQADHVDLPGLDRAKVIDLKLDGTKDAELYRMLLIAQCNALHAAMPFLFERIDDETELLLPDNLLHSDSLIRQMIGEIDEGDWQEIEIIGWLYQFYISEKKDQVIGKAVKSEDIPAATQLFTPNWIVKYMVQNSLGHQWLATYPASSLKAKMDYYIEPADQTGEVQAQLADITPKELNPEKITLLDPACGSGHILVEAYDLFKAIYEERGYTHRDIPRLILETNLYGLEIDDRAAQLAGFALLMKARADDRQIFESTPTMNVMAIQSNKGLDAAEIAHHLITKERVELVPSDDLMPDTLTQPVLAANATSEVKAGTIESLINLFADAKTFGSLITIPDNIAKALPALKLLVDSDEGDDFFRRQARQSFAPIVEQAEILARKYDCVVANPPYMGSKGMNPQLKKFVNSRYPNSKSDLFAIFMERNLELTTVHGLVAMITMQSWMFLSSYEKLRDIILERVNINSMVHLGTRAFDSIGGAVVSTTAFVLKRSLFSNYLGSFLRLVEGSSEAEKDSWLKKAIENSSCSKFYLSSTADLRKIPGHPIAYWASGNFSNSFANVPPVSAGAKTLAGMQTGDNDLFVRRWYEVSTKKIGFSSSSRTSARETKMKWFPYNKGGTFRRWYGNQEFLVNWANDGEFIKKKKSDDLFNGNITANNSKCWNQESYFLSGITWSKVSSGIPSFRYQPNGALFDIAGVTLFPNNKNQTNFLLGALNSTYSRKVLEMLSPTLNFETSQVAKVPVFLDSLVSAAQVDKSVACLVELAAADWNTYETSWNFVRSPLIDPDRRQSTLEKSYATLRSHWQGMTEEMHRHEEENNCLFINGYGLDEELTPGVPLEEVTLTCNPAYRYGGTLTGEEREQRLRADTIRELISYAIGCMMGRYSLDEPGLIYAHSGNGEFDASKYATFPADDDGVIPVTDTDWFNDDAARRFSEFLAVAWPSETLTENLRFVADSLSAKRGETPLDTIRRYLSTGFYKDHLKTYKKRPIYWLFSSGKQKAFECLVYLHRYNESTLSRMRMEYVIPLQGKFAARLDQLDGDIAAATSTANRRKLDKEMDSLLKKQAELVDFDDQLRHYADQRIALDLDDGVKVNYGKFGNLLAEVKAITGKE